MRRFRRRRARPLWFPPLGTDFTVGQDTKTTGLVTFQVDVPTTGDFNFTAIPLTFDAGQEDILQISSNVQVSLADLMNSTWRCRRVVGEIFATLAYPGERGDSISSVGRPPAVAFSAGLMVRRVGTTGNIVAADVQPLERNDYTDPWAWRRTWILGQGVEPKRYIALDGSLANSTKESGFSDLSGGGFDDTIAAFAHFPPTNCWGSSQTGPRIDAKTNRLIGPEDSLFMHFAVKPLPITVSSWGAGARVVGAFDLRLLGFLAKATNRRNASR